jgi:hypothetical protein
MTAAEDDAEERAIVAAIVALGEAELAAVKAWIASGCEVPPLAESLMEAKSPNPADSR